MIRLAQEQDVPQLLHIYNDAILHTTAVYTYEPQTLEMRTAWLLQKQEEGYPVFVFEKDGKAVGFATYGPFRPWPAYKYSIEHSIYVDPAYHRQGIAGQLLAALIEEAKQQQYKTIVAGIDATNAGSIILHERQGFVHAGTIQSAGYKFDQWLDLAFYQLVLDGPEHPVAK